MLRNAFPAAVVAVLAVALATADARPPTGKCRSKTGSIVAINSKVVVYELPRARRTPGNDAISGRLIACRRASGNRVQLSSSRFGDYWYDRPSRAVKIRGTTVGFAAVLDPGYGSSFATSISFIDMLRPTTTVGVPATGLIGSVDFEVVSARRQRDLTDRRAAAWIECPDLDDLANADPRPNCVRAGRSVNSVYAVARGELIPRRIRRGRAIDPRSVRVRDGRVSWVERKRRRSAAMPTT